MVGGFGLLWEFEPLVLVGEWETTQATHTFKGKLIGSLLIWEGHQAPPKRRLTGKPGKNRLARVAYVPDLHGSGASGAASGRRLAAWTVFCEVRDPFCFYRFNRKLVKVRNPFGGGKSLFGHIFRGLTLKRGRLIQRAARYNIFPGHYVSPWMILPEYRFGT